MNELSEKAKDILEARYMKPYHTVAAVIVAKDGKEYSGISIDYFSGYLCAEAAALAGAINDGQTEFDRVVAVGKNDNDYFDVVNPCGKCRQLLHDFAPGINVIVKEDGNETIVPIDALLPYGFKRRQEKLDAHDKGKM